MSPRYRPEAASSQRNSLKKTWPCKWCSFLLKTFLHTVCLQSRIHRHQPATECTSQYSKGIPTCSKCLSRVDLHLQSYIWNAFFVMPQLASPQACQGNNYFTQKLFRVNIGSKVNKYQPITFFWQCYMIMQEDSLHVAWTKMTIISIFLPVHLIPHKMWKCGDLPCAQLVSFHFKTITKKLFWMLCLGNIDI